MDWQALTRVAYQPILATDDGFKTSSITHEAVWAETTVKLSAFATLTAAGHSLRISQ